MAGLIYPSAPQIATLWLGSVELDADGIGTDLPDEPTTWAAHGFVQVPTAVGGTPDIDLPVRAPVVQLDCWTNRPNSPLAPWAKAEHLAGQVVAAALSQRGPVALELPDGFVSVRVDAVWAASEPRRVLGDPSRYAHVSLDLQMKWTLL